MDTRFFSPAPPQLETLHTKPSWHNRAGRVDRSACFVLTASHHWRQIPADEWTYRYPARQPAYHARGKCDRYADIHLWARDLWTFHKCESPYPLQGDFRSAKSNAMGAHKRRDKSTYREQAQRNDAVLGTGPVNPNRGVGFSHHKMLGLDCMWSNTLRIERYIQHAHLKQHFFVCPVCAPVAAGQRTGVTPSETYHSDSTPACYAAATIGGTSPPAKRKGLPVGRVTKLYLPLCTPQEWHDAHTAELWLRTHCHPNRPWPALAVQLIERYGELFEGQHARQLRCRDCLGLRYGEVKATYRHLSPRERAGVRGKQQRIQTEQSLFLTNLPKLLTKPLAIPPLPTGEDTGEGSAKGRGLITTKPINGNAVPSPQPSPKGRGGKQPPARTDDTAGIPPDIKDELLMLFAGQLPAFKTIAQAKQLPR
jgi:hypothetical protein